MNTIFINGKFFCQRVTGTQRYARELLNQFDNLLGADNPWKISISVLAPKNAFSIPAFKNLEVRTVGYMTGTMWEQLELPRFCKGKVLFTLSGGAPTLHPRNVVMLHDAAVVAAPTGYSLPYRLWHGHVCRKMAQTAELIFTNSHFSKSEIVKWYGALPEKISVTYLGSEHFQNIEADQRALKRFGISDRYVLAVSSHNPNKNFHAVVQAMEQLKESGAVLVIAGARDSRVYGKGVKLPDGIRRLGYVNDPELKALYQGASCFVFASLYEGFGLPPLEALASGCPIVLARAGSLPEIFEVIASFCDPYRPEDIARVIKNVLNAPTATPDELKAFAQKFSWEKCARETLDALNRVLLAH